MKSKDLARGEKIRLLALLKEKGKRNAKKDLLGFTKYTFPKFTSEQFHEVYYNILDRFANKEIKNLIISMPPQHGKSQGSSRQLPAYIVGKRPDDNIALISYAATKAQKFGREIMNIMREPSYSSVFPEVNYPERGYTGARANTNESRESINSDGSMKFVGVNGALTGDPVDVLIMDDLYKDWKEANSPIIRESVWDWYISVADTRLHNDSQQLIVFTRWSEDDLIGRLDDLGKVVELDFDSDIDESIKGLKHDEFLKINFPALQDVSPSLLDPREKGEALWPKRHSKQKLLSSREKDPVKFNCLHQGDPQSKEGLLYKPFKEYFDLPEIKIIKNYTDTADTGDDYLCSVVYGIPLSGSDNNIYVIDVLYTQESMEYTEPKTINLLNHNHVNESDIESNNGGRGFARVIDRDVNAEVNWFHQSKNKEARIYSQSATVNNKIIFPSNWHIQWPEFYDHISKYKKVFKANKHDDAPDTLTGIIEKADNVLDDFSVTIE